MSIFSKIFPEPEKEELVLVFDIGSSSVGGALFFKQSSKAPRIILSIREPIVLENKLDHERLLSLTMKALETVASRICISGLGAPSRILCVLSSPWYASQSRVVRFKKNTPFIFTHKLANDLIKKEISLLKEEHSSKFEKNGARVSHFELRSMKTLLNGYPISNPLGRKAKELEMMIFVSMSEEEVLRKIEDVIFRHFHIREVKYSSFVMAAFTVARDIFIQEEDFLLIDIGGEMTDISIIKRGILQESASFPLGRNFMIRKVASAFNSTTSEAKSLISLYKDAHAHGSTEKKLLPLMNKLKNEWQNSLEGSLANLSKNIPVPPKIFITVDADMASFFSDIIKNEQFTQYALALSKFEVVNLNTKTLHGAASFEENVTRDPFLVIESAYLNRSLSLK